MRNINKTNNEVTKMKRESNEVTNMKLENGGYDMKREVMYSGSSLTVEEAMKAG